MVGLLEEETGAAGSGSGFAGREVEGPVLADEVVAERVVLFLGEEAEPLGDIDLARRVQDVVRPERQLRIAGLPREADAGAHQPSAEPEPARFRLDIEEPQLRDLVRLRTRNTEPTIPPSISAIQQRSRPASKLSMKPAQISATSASKLSSQPYSWW